MPESFKHRGVLISLHRQRWRWRVQHEGQRTVRSAATADEARRLLDQFLDARDRRQRRHSTTSKRPVTVRELCEAWFIYKRPTLAPATEQQYGIHIRVHIIPGLGSTDANSVRPREIEAFYRSLRWKPAKESHNILRQAFEWGLRNDMLVRESNPCLVVRPSRRTSTDHDGYYDSDGRMAPIDDKDIPTREEVEKLIVDAEAQANSHWWLYLKLASSTGARPGEICALRRRDIDPERHTIHIGWGADRVSGRIKRPKTRWSIRTLPLAAELFEAIASALPDDSDVFLFPSNTQPGATSPLPCWNSRSVKRQLDKAIARIGIKHVTPHAFRHYVATRLLAEGKSPLQVARFLGHANDALVRTLYANHILDEAQREIGEAASRLV